MKGTAATEYQISGAFQAGVAFGTHGETPLFGGLSLKWGYIAAMPVNPAGTAYTFVGTFGLTAYATACFGVWLMSTPVGGHSNVAYMVNNPTIAGFTASSYGAACNTWFIALGI